MASMTMLVTGSTGKVGRQVVHQLRARGQQVRAFARGEGGDLTDVDSVRAALAGVRKVFLVWPFFQVDTLPEILEVLAAEPRQVVYLSSEGSPPWAMDAEALIEQTSLEWTFLRPTGFAGNALEFAPQIKAGDIVHWPYANLARPFIHEHDIAAVGVRALLEEGHAGAKYSLSGPEYVTQAEQVEIIGEVLGRQVKFDEITPTQAETQFQAAGWPPELITGALAGWATMLANPEAITSTVEQVTGKPAKTFRQWAEDNATAFRP